MIIPLEYIMQILLCLYIWIAYTIIARGARIHFSFFHGFTMQNSYSTYIISDNGLLFPIGVISTPFYNCPTFLKYLHFV